MVPLHKLKKWHQTVPIVIVFLAATHSQIKANSLKDGIDEAGKKLYKLISFLFNSLSDKMGNLYKALLSRKKKQNKTLFLQLSHKLN